MAWYKGVKMQYHIHSLTSANETSSDPTEGLPDNYRSNTSQGCFTKKIYTNHIHNDSCYARHGTWYLEVGSGDGWYHRALICPTCGECGGVETQDTPDYHLNDRVNTIHWCDGVVYKCNNQPNNANAVYICDCGYKQGDEV